MQHGKITKNIEQIEKTSSTPEEITDNIQTVMDKFGISRVLPPLNSMKRSGTSVSVILIALIILPFVAKDSIWSCFLEKNNPKKQGAKDSYYDVKNNPKLNWRILLYSKAFCLFVVERQTKDNRTNKSIDIR